MHLQQQKNLFFLPLACNAYLMLNYSMRLLILYYFKIMKNLIPLLLFFCLGCVKNTPVEEPCIDESLINELTACYLIYAPVCGCNNITYSNDCVAENNGVLNYLEGSCEEIN